MMRDALPLVDLLGAPERAAKLSAEQWTDLISIARAEALLGTLAHRLAAEHLPPRVADTFADARTQAEHNRTRALWEADCARRALAGVTDKVTLLKGAAYAAAELDAAQGRQIGDLDILVPRADLPAVEAALLAAGWEWVKQDAYDDHYYRQWMHELPPLIHRERDQMIDVHHTILPLTARPTPDATRLIDNAVALDNGLFILSPAEMVLHAAAHLFADGDVSGGLRNLWDIHCLVTQFAAAQEDFWQVLGGRAEVHRLEKPLARALRLAHRLYDTDIYKYRAGETRASDFLYLRRLLARDGYGRATQPLTRQAFYIRSHLLRMPPPLLARHLWTKWRKGSTKR
jgi:hypothetical protein